jgi:hypothetical protein
VHVCGVFGYVTNDVTAAVLKSEESKTTKSGNNCLLLWVLFVVVGRHWPLEEYCTVQYMYWLLVVIELTTYFHLIRPLLAYYCEQFYC